jgi:integral membrane protein
LKAASLAEASTLAALVLIAVPMKHFAGADGFVHVMGPLHGAVFLLYLWTLIRAAGAGGWRIGEVIRMIVVACIPLAGFVNQPWLARKLRALPAYAADR